MYCKGLTRQELKEMGIVDVYRDNTEPYSGWAVIREWHKNNSKTMKTRYKVNIGLAVTKHKYTRDKVYPKIGISYKNKPVAIPISRLVYVWFIEDIPDGYVIDHINNNQFDNRPENLRMLSIKGNIAKRVDDLGCRCFNQYKNTEY